MSRMTPTPTDDRLPAALALAEIPAERIDLYFVSTCHRCAPELGEPFATDTERDAHAIGHITATGHVVHLTIEVDGEPLGEHTSAVLEFDPTGGWYFTCTHPTCERRNGRYDSGQLAVASFRAHTVKATA